MGSSLTATDTLTGSLATGVVHDLRNVLFVIRAQAERLLEGLDPADPRATDLQAIRDTAQRGVALARQMFATERNGADKPVDASDVIGRMLPLVTRLAGDRVAVATALDSTWPVTANAVQVEQIVMNLVTNARDAMPDGGRLLIRTEHAPASGTPARDAVVISVADTGGGIDPAVRDRIFEPYFTTRAETGGTGVGLATVRGIAHLHGGRVEVESTPGGGATFRVVLPRAATLEAVTSPARAAQPAPPARILLVENEPAIREYLQRCLVAAGYEVQAAASGRDALVVDAARPPADVLVADVRLPDVEGPEVARRLRERWPAVRVVFMSGGLDALDGLDEGGTVPLLAKPFTATELVKAIRTVLAPDEGR